MNTYRHGFYFNETKSRFENWISNTLNSKLSNRSELSYDKYLEWCVQQFGDIVSPSKAIRYAEVKN